MQEARKTGEERREESWSGKRGQAERAAQAEMNSTVQGQGAAEYAVRCEHMRLPTPEDMHAVQESVAVADATISFMITTTYRWESHIA